MKIFYKTYGCQMNVRDTEAVRVLLERHGYEFTDDESAADIILVNTCSVRGKAEDKAIGKLGLLTAEESRHRALVGAMGCMVQRLQSRLFHSVPKLDFAVGTKQAERLPEIIARVRAGETGVLAADDDAVHPGENLDGHVIEPGRAGAFVNILYGCNRCCSYCIVPYVRGNEWSRPAVDIIQEVKALVKSGIQEVTLLGQSVMRYGLENDVWKDIPLSARKGFKEPLPGLLAALCEIDGLTRIRFTSGHPSGCTAELARAMDELPPVCEHLHLPVQSGSDAILKRMRRGYTVAEYLAAVDLLRNNVDNPVFTTDIIVGFPGETEQDFEATRDLMEQVGFMNAFIFKYSPREGTPAAEWDDDVSSEEKLRRNKLLLDDQNRRSLALNQELAGKVVEVLVDGVSARNVERWSGRTRRNRIVVFEPPAGIRTGMLLNVKINRVMAQTLYGEVVAGGHAGE